jgi:hypothetical protein
MVPSIPDEREVSFYSQRIQSDLSVHGVAKLARKLLPSPLQGIMDF